MSLLTKLTRYHQLVLHDPVWYDHLPYLPFPPNWPVFTPKDKLADWFESYAMNLELNVWTSTSITSTTWSDSNREWTVTLCRKNPSGKTETRTLHPRHIVQATGHSGEPMMPEIEGISSFAGNLCHSSQFQGAQVSPQGSKKKRAVVVGCCNSGHDIAQDFYEHGYDVTMVQRSSTYVTSSKQVLGVLLAGLYEEGGPDTEDADLLFMSIPNAVLKRMHVDATIEISKRDEKLRVGLEKAGFKLDNGPDDAGIWTIPTSFSIFKKNLSLTPSRLLHQILPARRRLLHRRRLLLAHRLGCHPHQARTRSRPRHPARPAPGRRH